MSIDVLKNSNIQKTGLFFLKLGLIALLGSWLLKISTPFGLGLSDDSVAYIAGGRSILRGQGYSQIWLASELQPVTHFPPLYSAVLAMIGLFGLDPLRGVRLLNILLFSANAVLLGILGSRMTQSRVAGLMLAVLFVGNSSLMHVHSFAQSEPLYLFFSLVAFLLFAVYFEKEQTAWLIGAGFAIGLAYLTRYAGLALLATFAIALLLLHTTWRKRIVSLVVLFGSAIPWLLAWTIRNKILAGNITNRTMQWHPVTMENIRRGIFNFSRYLIPIEDWRKSLTKIPGLIEGILLLIGLGLLIWLVIVSLRFLSKPTLNQRPEIISYSTGIYIYGYLISLMISISLFDASTPLKERILSPIYVSLLILLVALGMWIWNLQHQNWRTFVVLFTILILGTSFFDQYRTVEDLKKDGQGFASWQWYDSKVMAAIGQISIEVMIYTNQPTAVYIRTNRPCLVLPNSTDPVTLQPFQDYQQQALEQMKQDILQGNAVLVLFNSADTDNPEFQENLDELTSGLFLALKVEGDAIYTAQP